MINDFLCFHISAIELSWSWKCKSGSQIPKSHVGYYKMINCVPGLGSDVTWDCHFSSFSSVTSVLVYRLKREHTCFYVFHVQESFFFFLHLFYNYNKCCENVGKHNGCIEIYREGEGIKI